jgi:serine/threonine protein kinase
VKLLGLCKHNATLFIITDFIEGGDLRRHLKNKNLKLSWSLRVRIARDCAAAMAYMHSKNILHRDFKFGIVQDFHFFHSFVSGFVVCVLLATCLNDVCCRARTYWSQWTGA